METQFTDEELDRMRSYEQRTGQKIVYSFEERCAIYRAQPRNVLERTENGISQCIIGRQNLDNQDSFNNPDDSWKLKTLEENLKAIKKVLSEK